MSKKDSIRDQLIYHEKEPVVLSGFISSWKAANWTPDILATVFQERPLQFRIGKNSSEVQWENKCEYISATVSEFNDWVNGVCCSENPLQCYDRAKHWFYADYKYMAELFEDQPQFLKAVDWSVLGFENRGGQQSTFWFGSEGSNTVCHCDTYGCNVVAQLYGRKRWVMFAPSDTKYMYPTRIPYEESSVFSQVSIKSPDLKRFPEFQHATPYIVTLEPGDILFVPPKWWHFVESLDTSLSVNSWIEMGSDDVERLREAVTRTMAFMLMSEDGISVNLWLNPTEDITERTQNLEYIRLALSTVLKSGSASDFFKQPIPDDPKKDHIKRCSEDDDSEKPNFKRGKTSGSEPGDSSVIRQFSSSCMQKVPSFVWNDYCRLLDTDATTEQRKLVNDMEAENVHRKDVDVSKPNADFQEPSCSTSDATFSDSTCPLASHSGNGIPEVTAFDLADIFLDPEVIDFMCKKIVKKFQIATF